MSKNNFLKTDRFGQPFTVVGCKPSKNEDFCAGYVELGGKLYKLEPSDANKDGVKMWIRVTKVDQSKRPTSM